MAGTSAKTSSTVEIVNITPRRRWSVGEKIRLIEASMAPGQSVSLVVTTSAFFACVQNRFSESRSDLFPSLLSWQPWVSFDVVSAWRAACERLTHKEVALQAA